MKYQIGQKFGKLTIIEDETRFTTVGGYSYLRHNCKCDCGNTVYVRKGSITSNKVISCGCVQRGKDGIIHKRHRYYGTPIYQSWFAMKSRCFDKNNNAYENYNGRGITVCDKWLSFSGFYEDMGESYINGYSIDRIDNYKGYSKDNCRWADCQTQAYNKRMLATNKSGKTGVCWSKTDKRWRVKFNEPINKSQIVKLFEYLWDAVYYRMELEQKYYGYVKD